MGIGKGENKNTWDDFLKSQQGGQAKKTGAASGRASGSGTSGKDKESEKNGGGTEGAGGGTQPTDFNALTVEKLKEQLAAKGIEIPADAKKADLVALLEQE